MLNWYWLVLKMIVSCFYYMCHGYTTYMWIWWTWIYLEYHFSFLTVPPLQKKVPTLMLLDGNAIVFAWYSNVLPVILCCKNTILPWYHVHNLQSHIMTSLFSSRLLYSMSTLKGWGELKRITWAMKSLMSSLPGTWLKWVSCQEGQSVC